MDGDVGLLAWRANTNSQHFSYKFHGCFTIKHFRTICKSLVGWLLVLVRLAGSNMFDQHLFAPTLCLLAHNRRIHTATPQTVHTTAAASTTQRVTKLTIWNQYVHIKRKQFVTDTGREPPNRIRFAIRSESGGIK